MFEKVFHLKENNTTVRTEVIAGITTFMTMAYILAVNPNMLAAAWPLLWGPGPWRSLRIIHLRWLPAWD